MSSSLAEPVKRESIKKEESGGDMDATKSQEPSEATSRKEAEQDEKGAARIRRNVSGGVSNLAAAVSREAGSADDATKQQPQQKQDDGSNLQQRPSSNVAMQTMASVAASTPATTAPAVVTQQPQETIVGMVGNTPILKIQGTVGRAVKKKKGRFTVLEDTSLVPPQDTRAANVATEQKPVQSVAVAVADTLTVASTETLDEGAAPVVKKKGRFVVTNLKNPAAVAMQVPLASTTIVSSAGPSPVVSHPHITTLQDTQPPNQPISQTMAQPQLPNLDMQAGTPQIHQQTQPASNHQSSQMNTEISQHQLPPQMAQAEGQQQPTMSQMPQATMQSHMPQVNLETQQQLLAGQLPSSLPPQIPQTSPVVQQQHLVTGQIQPNLQTISPQIMQEPQQLVASAQVLPGGPQQLQLPQMNPDLQQQHVAAQMPPTVSQMPQMNVDMPQQQFQGNQIQQSGISILPTGINTETQSSPVGQIPQANMQSQIPSVALDNATLMQYAPIITDPQQQQQQQQQQFVIANLPRVLQVPQIPTSVYQLSMPQLLFPAQQTTQGLSAGGSQHFVSQILLPQQAAIPYTPQQTQVPAAPVAQDVQSVQPTASGAAQAPAPQKAVPLASVEKSVATESGQLPPKPVSKRKPRVPSSFDSKGLGSQVGLGKVFYFLDQMKSEVSEADRTIKSLQTDLKCLKEKNKELEARKIDMEKKWKEERTLRLAAETREKALKKRIKDMTSSKGSAGDNVADDELVMSQQSYLKQQLDRSRSNSFDSTGAPETNPGLTSQSSSRNLDSKGGVEGNIKLGTTQLAGTGALKAVSALNSVPGGKGIVMPDGSFAIDVPTPATTPVKPSSKKAFKPSGDDPLDIIVKSSGSDIGESESSSPAHRRLGSYSNGFSGNTSSVPKQLGKTDSGASNIDQNSVRQVPSSASFDPLRPQPSVQQMSATDDLMGLHNPAALVNPNPMEVQPSMLPGQTVASSSIQGTHPMVTLPQQPYILQMQGNQQLPVSWGQPPMSQQPVSWVQESSVSQPPSPFPVTHKQAPGQQQQLYMPGQSLNHSLPQRQLSVQQRSHSVGSDPFDELLSLRQNQGSGVNGANM